MAGLSSITAITRPLGEVNLAAMNRCTGVYRVYLSGGGGGGGGYDDFYKWYGDAGEQASLDTHTGSLVPPITLSAGAGGSPAVGYLDIGQQGGVASIGDSRLANIIVTSGGSGGASASVIKSLYPTTPRILFAVLNSRFTIATSYSTPSTPYFTVTEGRGGGSMEEGWQGGIIKAFRIG